MTERKKSDRRRRRAAAALRYKPSEDPAPKVAAVGRGHVADRIIAVAAEHGIRVYDDPDLVEVLAPARSRGCHTTGTLPGNRRSSGVRLRDKFDCGRSIWWAIGETGALSSKLAGQATGGSACPDDGSPGKRAADQLQKDRRMPA